MLGRFDRPVRKLAGWSEFEAQARFFDSQGAAQIVQQQGDEDLVGRNVQQRSFPRALTHRGKCARIVTLAIEPHPLDLHRQYVTRRRAALRRLKEGKPGPVVANITEGDSRGQSRVNRICRTFRVPAGSRQMSRQDIAFEYAAGTGQ